MRAEVRGDVGSDVRVEVRGDVGEGVCAEVRDDVGERACAEVRVDGTATRGFFAVVTAPVRGRLAAAPRRAMGALALGALAVGLAGMVFTV